MRIFFVSTLVTLTIGLIGSCAFVGLDGLTPPSTENSVAPIAEIVASDQARAVLPEPTQAAVTEVAPPTAEPTEEPAIEPTAKPTAEPTVEPTAEPTLEPTLEATREPTEDPAEEPAPEPTDEPIPEPTPEPTAEPTPQPTEVAVVVVQAERMNARQGPGIDFPVVDQVVAGQTGQVVAVGDQGNWYLVQFDEIETPVWVYAGLVDLSGNGAGVQPLAQVDPAVLPPTPEATATPSVPVAVVQARNMNVRSGPSTAYGVVTTAQAGTVAEIQGSSPDGQWYLVQLDGQDDPAWLYAGLTQAAGPTDQIAQVPEDQLPPTPTPAPAPVVSAASSSASSPSTVVSAPAPTSGGSFGYGVQAHLIHTGQSSIEFAMDRTRDLGFSWMKQQIEWRIFEPNQGQYGFGDIGPVVGAANLRGINLLFSVVNAPDWAREPGFDANVGGPPQDPNTYAAFVGRLAGEYCGTSLKAIEVWNEQNLHYEWGNRALNPADYMNLLRPAYAAIKNACPSMYVISGALTPAGSNGNLAVDDMQYLEGMFQNGVANYADAIGAHPSGYNVPPSVGWQDACGVIQQTGNSFNGACDSPHHSWSFRSTLEGYRNIAVKYGAADKRIWPTEFGWAAGGAFHPAYAYANDNSFEEQAAWTVEAYQMMRNWGWVGPAFLWNLNFRVVADSTEKAQWGIVRNDWSPLPVYEALRAMPK